MAGRGCGVKKANASAGGCEMLEEGDAAPELRDEQGEPARDMDGSAVSLEELRSEGPVLLVFLRGFS
jgi:hypothetical protein